MTDFVGGLAGVGVSEFNCHSHRLRAPNPVRTDRMPRDVCREISTPSLDTLSKDMRGVFCPSDSHHVRRHLENPLNFRPEICGETASQNTPDTGITSIGGADRRFGYPPPPPPGQWGTNPDFSGGSTSASEPPGGIFAPGLISRSIARPDHSGS